MVHLKLHTKYLIRTLENVYFIHIWKFKSSYVFFKRPQMTHVYMRQWTLVNTASCSCLLHITIPTISWISTGLLSVGLSWTNVSDVLIRKDIFLYGNLIGCIPCRLSAILSQLNVKIIWLYSYFWNLVDLGSFRNYYCQNISRAVLC